jgi:hypothetical protein
VKHSYAELLEEMRLGSSSTPQRARLNQWPGSILTLQSISSVSRKMKATAFWNVYGVIILVDFIPPSSTANASAYQETLNRLKEAIQKRDQDC